MRPTAHQSRASLGLCPRPEARRNCSSRPKTVRRSSRTTSRLENRKMAACTSAWDTMRLEIETCFASSSPRTCRYNQRAASIAVSTISRRSPSGMRRLCWFALGPNGVPSGTHAARVTARPENRSQPAERKAATAPIDGRLHSDGAFTPESGTTLSIRTSAVTASIGGRATSRKRREAESRSDPAGRPSFQDPYLIEQP
jgi:hypothetical protein